MIQVNIIGAGLAGLSSALTLADNNIQVNLISNMPSERAQSSLAEGGINAAMNVSGENDDATGHFTDTMHAGCDIADADAVMNLTHEAPDIMRELIALGVPFNSSGGTIEQRYFGGQKKRRTAYAKSITGKALMNALIDQARKYEVQGLITRYPHHEFVSIKKDISCKGVYIRDTYTNESSYLPGPVIMATGGLNGLLPEITTGTTINTGNAAAELFSKGVTFSNLEMVQFHPTTMPISGKRCLITEAARGEGGRLFVRTKDDRDIYYMEEKYPELGNLMPRDVVSRESYFVMHDDNNDPQIYLDMRHLSSDIWKNKIPEVREQIIRYKGIDPATTPVPIEPGIHYFMGGIDVDINHRTNITGLYAAGECCSQYHGANRLGGNSTMGAIYGGKVAARSVTSDLNTFTIEKDNDDMNAPTVRSETYAISIMARDIFTKSMGIVRNEASITAGIDSLDELIIDVRCNDMDKKRITLIKAMLMSALYRKESRGAHYRSDYPDRDDTYKKLITCRYDNNEVVIDAI